LHFKENFEDESLDLVPSKKVKVVKSDSKKAEILIEWRKSKILPNPTITNSSK
jgi:hypothetical protein